jgi:hypothetical protein
MEVVGAVASIITLAALTKELSTLIEALLQDVQHAPRQLVQVSNQVSLIFLELECIKQLQQDANIGFQLPGEELWILQQALTIAMNNITAIHKECEKRISVTKGRRSSRFSWALFDSKAMNGALEQLQRTESHLLFVTQVINMYVKLKHVYGPALTHCPLLGSEALEHT